MKVIKTIFQIRRGTAADWQKLNPILRLGEPAFEVDTYSFKIGNGVTPYKNLPYVVAGSDIEQALYERLNQVEDTVAALEEKVQNLSDKDAAVIRAIAANGADLAIVNGRVDIPMATKVRLGLVKSSDEENKVSVLADGTLEVNSLNINKLVQTEGEEFVLRG